MAKALYWTLGLVGVTLAIPGLYLTISLVYTGLYGNMSAGDGDALLVLILVSPFLAAAIFGGTALACWSFISLWKRRNAASGPALNH